MVIDVHAHIFEKVNGRIGEGVTLGAGYGKVTVGGRTIQVLPPLNESVVYTADMLLHSMNNAGVDKAVLLQGPFYGECNELVAGTVSKYPDRFAGAAYIDPWSLHFYKELSEICKIKEFVSLKIECSVSTGLFGVYKHASLDDDVIHWMCSKMEGLGLVLTLDLGAIGSRSYQTEAVREIARRYKDLKIVICHLAQPNPLLDTDEASLDLWKRQIDLGQFPNIWFDTAALPAYFSSEIFPFKSAEKYFKMAVKLIGAEKIMWGTDVPGLLTHATYNQLIELADIYSEEFNQQQKQLIMVQNALNVYFRK